jgi:hypothetical protein
MGFRLRRCRVGYSITLLAAVHNSTSYDLSNAYLCHDRAGTDRSAFSNHPVGVDDGPATDNHLVLDDDGASRQSSLGTLPRRIFVGDIAEKAHVFANLHAGPDEDVARVFDRAVFANVRVVADVDVVAVVAGERGFDDDARADAARAGLRAVVISVLVVWFGSFGWVEDAFEETAFLGGTGGAGVGVGLVPVLDRCCARPAVVQQVFVDVGAVGLADEHFVFFRRFA